MLSKSRAILAATALAFTSAAVATPALAQSAGQGTQAAPPAATAPAPAPQAANVDDAKVKSFAVAYLQVDKIKKQYQPKLAQAKSNADKEKVKTEASQQMVSAVNGVKGMNVQEYSSILASAQSDPALAKKLTGAINQQAGSGN